MADVGYKPGTFCWVELGTTDVPAAKAFYSELAGWSFMDVPMGDGETYSMFEQGGHHRAGLYALKKEQLDMKVPPHWMNYVLVSNVDETLAKAAEEFLSHRINALPVIGHDGKVVGIITSDDVLRAVFVGECATKRPDL